MSKIQIESNSQLWYTVMSILLSCVYHVKDTNRKQFTTAICFCAANALLCLSCQRYKSKAIHNFVNSFLKFSIAVFIMSKIQIESNSQLISAAHRLEHCCVYHVKDTNRKQFTTVHRKGTISSWLCLSCQRYKSKAIHNPVQTITGWAGAVFIMSKIQIESNSQRKTVFSAGR